MSTRRHRVSWLRMLEKLVVDIFSSHAQTLQDWREQVPTGGNRVKNFENWLLVEFVHRLRQAGAFLWVLLEPSKDPFQSRFRKSVERTCVKARSDWGLDLSPVSAPTVPGRSNC